MALQAGFRVGKVLELVTEGELSTRGNYVLAEFTNDNAEKVYVTINEHNDQGHRGVRIPVEPGKTRAVPMSIYHFKATAPVTVVAYGM